MSRGSLTNLLGLVAVAGYQNRDKIAEMLRGATSGGPPASGLNKPQGGLDGLLSNLGGTGVGGLLGGGLKELVERFQQSGQGDIADSWVGPGPIPDVLATLSQQTGLSREEILARLSKELPVAVDKYTPEGRLPPQQDI